MSSATLGTRLYTWLRGQEAGRDEYGNIYYRERGGGHVHGDSLRRERRWVIYADEAEASLVPPMWNAWLHHTVQEVPPADGGPKRPWQKPHKANATGTPEAYRPPGHTLEGGRRAKGTGDYQAWRPE